MHTGRECKRVSSEQCPCRRSTDTPLEHTQTLTLQICMYIYAYIYVNIHLAACTDRLGGSRGICMEYVRKRCRSEQKNGQNFGGFPVSGDENLKEKKEKRTKKRQ